MHRVNNIELRNRVHTAMYDLIKDKGIASPVEVLMEIGILSKDDFENWRFGRIPYLEQVCKINLSKLSTIMREIRSFATKNNLKPSWTYYRQWGKGSTKLLRFSKSGSESIERAYATHYVSQHKVVEAQERRKLKKQPEEAASTTAEPIAE